LGPDLISDYTLKLRDRDLKHSNYSHVITDKYGTIIARTNSEEQAVAWVRQHTADLDVAQDAEPVRNRYTLELGGEDNKLFIHPTAMMFYLDEKGNPRGMYRWIEHEINTQYADIMHDNYRAMAMGSLSVSNSRMVFRYISVDSDSAIFALRQFSEDAGIIPPPSTTRVGGRLGEVSKTQVKAKC